MTRDQVLALATSPDGLGQIDDAVAALAGVAKALDGRYARQEASGWSVWPERGYRPTFDQNLAIDAVVRWAIVGGKLSDTRARVYLKALISITNGDEAIAIGQDSQPLPLAEQAIPLIVKVFLMSFASPKDRCIALLIAAGEEEWGNGQ